MEPDLQCIEAQPLLIETKAKKIERLEKKLLHYMGKAIADYHMIQKGDRVLVCVSGGKDSYGLVTLLEQLRQKAPLRFELQAFTLDQGQPGWDDAGLKAYLTGQKIPFEVCSENTYAIVKEKIPEGKTYCSLCSRLRRGIIYGYAKKNGFNKIALGHHRDDLIVTTLMSMLYNGEIRSMPPKLLTDDKRHIVIRPLCYVQEQDLAAYAALKQFPIIPCNLCGSQANLMRQKIKRLLQGLSADNPKVPSNLLRAIQNIKLSQMADRTLWSFRDLERQILLDPLLDGEVALENAPLF